GGAVSSLYAGLYPKRVQGLALIDNAGMWWRPVREHPSFLRHCISDTKRAANKRKPLYASVHDALVARSTGARIPLTYDAAKVLVSRGLMEVELEAEEGTSGEDTARSKYVIKGNADKSVKSGEQAAKKARDEDDTEDEDDEGSSKNETNVWYTWRTDPALTMSRGPMWADTVVAEFMQQITCPTMMVLAAGGHWVSNLSNPKVAPEDRTADRFAHPCGGKSRIVVMEGSHHLHLETRFAECGQLVADFFLNRDGARDRLGSSGVDLARAPEVEVAKQLGKG
ncbi:hypothetical protein HDU93_005452, partial [Gonapodya sp. JEL0774]